MSRPAACASREVVGAAERRRSGRVVRVAVDALADRPERTFSYLLPADVGRASPGSLLLVPYGRRLALGYLLADEGSVPIGATSDEELRRVEAIVSTPMLTDDLLRLAEEVAAYYRAPIGATLAAMLPPGVDARVRRRWRIVDPDGVPAPAVSASRDGLVDETILLRHVPRRGRELWLEGLRRRGSVRAEWILEPPAIGPRRVRVLRLSPGATPAGPRRRAPLQAAMLAELADGEERTLAEVAELLGIEPARLLAPARRLVERGLAELNWRDEARDPLGHRPIGHALRHALADEQAAALEALERLSPGGELLLEGVAASGKTDVYLAALEGELERGRGSIVLVPEISLVPQIADRLRSTIGDRLAVLHSGLSAGERHDEWWRVLRGEALVVVGTRGAVFAPVARLGLIVVDEEHDGGYKSDRSPRYDARWAARRRVALTGARLVSGSATPDIVTLARVRGGHADRVRLAERRVGERPSVEIIDMRAELAAGNRGIFSTSLAAALGSLEPASGRQAILLINRRGASTFILCRDCGASLRCPDCGLPFVYHLEGGQLRCHHCGRGGVVPEACPSCASRRIRYFGAGTQRVEAELRARWPRLRVGRLDSDVLGARRGFESVYDDFRDGRTDVLVGTQLAAKGLDLPSVTLVAVVAADVTLNLPDYRAAERTFQLVAQVAGRAGRGPLPGRVIVQTYSPGSYAIRAAAKLDSDAFADEELLRRRLLGYPPYSVLARLFVADADRDRAEKRGGRVAEAVRVDEVEVLGPLPAYVARRAGRWRFQVVVRAPSAAARSAALERVPPGVAVDVDPESLL